MLTAVMLAAPMLTATMVTRDHVKYHQRHVISHKMGHATHFRCGNMQRGENSRWRNESHT